MSQISIKSALYTAIDALPGALDTVKPNITFNPVPGIPYQKVNTIFARPEEPTAGSDFYREVGTLQVTLFYPLLQGEGPAMSRAELIRNAFPKGSSVITNSIEIHFDSVAQIIDGVPSNENFVVIVRIPFYANIFS